MTLNDLERCNSRYVRYFTEFGSFRERIA